MKLIAKNVSDAGYVKKFAQRNVLKENLKCRTRLLRKIVSVAVAASQNVNLKQLKNINND